MAGRLCIGMQKATRFPHRSFLVLLLMMITLYIFHAGANGGF